MLVAGAVTLTGRSGVPPLTVAGLVGLGALSALVVGMSGALIDRMAPERDAAHDAPGWAARMWPRHLEIQAEGYAALSRRRPGPGR